MNFYKNLVLVVSVCCIASNKAMENNGMVKIASKKDIRPLSIL